MTTSCEMVFHNFISGMHENEEGSVSSSATVRIKGNQLFNYSTPILERYNGSYIFNASYYSPTTMQIQKRIKKILPNGYKIVNGVPKDYAGCLHDFLEL